jgi:hypothetical protein
MSTMPKSRTPRNPLDELDTLALLLAKLIARALAAEIKPLLQVDDNELVDRKSCGISKRQWDQMVATGELSVMKDGRRYVARRADVLRALERRRVIREPERAPLNKEESELEAAGIRLGGSDR